MDTQPELIKQSEMLNRLVLDCRTTEEVGRVDQLWLNPLFHQVVGLTCKSGLLGAKKRLFAWAQIETIGTDSVLVSYDPKEDEPEKPDSAVSLIGHEVWTDAGNKVGKVVDYLFAPDTGAIANYLFVSSGWRGVLDGIYLLPTTAIAGAGSKRVIVVDATVQEPQRYTEGLNQKVTQAAEFFLEDYKKTQSDWEAIKRSAQTITEQVKDTSEKVAKIAQEKLSEVKAKEQEASQLDDSVMTIDTTAEHVENTPELPESNR
ncbi:MAG: PRC-barrel domain-containing protein [Coleofasciculus sp. S288]|nr:PRC-barrel domain-containing protein [Coleofasciculus sp. S288]